MKVTDVECLILDESFPFVRVHTDEGLTGIGECFRRQPKVTKTLIDNLLRPALVGKDPTETDVRFREMARAANALELGGAIWCAIAGLDIALWDLKGKALGVPIYKLLGGKVRDKVRMYASSMRRDMTPLEEGKRADLMLVRGRPDQRISDIRNSEIVFKNGVGFDSEALLESVSGTIGD